MGSPNLGPPTFLLEGRSPRVQVPLWKRRQLQAGEPSCTWVSPSPGPVPQSTRVPSQMLSLWLHEWQEGHCLTCDTPREWHLGSGKLPTPTERRQLPKMIHSQQQLPPWGPTAGHQPLLWEQEPPLHLLLALRGSRAPLYSLLRPHPATVGPGSRGQGGRCRPMCPSRALVALMWDGLAAPTGAGGGASPAGRQQAPTAG